MSTGTLLLNASYEPLVVPPMRRAVALIQRGTVEVLEWDHSRKIRSGHQEMSYPVVIRLKKMVKIPYRLLGRVTNTFLFARDNYTCQYCGREDDNLKGRLNKLTRDHVQPRSRGGEDIWTNVVTACSSCNSRKDNKTPKEAGMTLRRQPQTPHMVHLKWQIRSLTQMQIKYVEMFYGDNWMLYIDEKSK